jgi:hypothetical protein
LVYDLTMSRFGSEYQIAKATGRCESSGEPLEPGSVCVATLCDKAGEEGFDRKDFSLAAWEKGARPQGLFSFWKTTVPHPDARPNPLVDDSVLMDLFERLASDDRPQRVAFRFVLTLILMRKKLLKFVGRAAAEGGPGEQWLMQPRGADPSLPPLAVRNPNLSDEDVREIIEQLSEILQSEL